MGRLSVFKCGRIHNNDHSPVQNLASYPFILYWTQSKCNSRSRERFKASHVGKGSWIGVKLEVVSDKLTACLLKFEIREKSRLMIKGRFFYIFTLPYVPKNTFIVKGLNLWKLPKKTKLLTLRVVGSH
jgi:hypothetical protein